MRTKKRLETRKRFYADCSKCTLSFDCCKAEDTVKRCICGELLTWSDRVTLRTLEGVRKSKK